MVTNDLCRKSAKCIKIKKRGNALTKKGDKQEQAGGWTKAQIMASSKYTHQRDVLQAILKDDEWYTVADVDGLIDEYMKGGVS